MTKKLWSLLGSYGLACALLAMLFVLTLLGTIEQTEHGLYEVQKKYFDSLFFVHWIGGRVPLPLPGVFTVLGVLAVNLVVGGLIRIRKSAATLGVIVVHIGILLMFAAGFVKLEFSSDGHLTLYENERSDEFESYFEWEVAIFDATQPANVRELLIPQSDFTDLAGERSRTFTSDELPFKVTLSRYLGNAFAMPARAPMRRGNLPLVDGWALEPAPLAKEAEQNLAGLYVRLEDARGSAAPRDAIVWAGERLPLAFDWGQRSWAISLRHRRFKMPFTIALEKFTHEEHPRTGIAKVFMSDVVKIENGVEQPVKIEMNQPLRHEGLVLFQASWGPTDARPGDPVFSTFAVVRNPSDQWPLISCIVIAIGMLLAFGRKLVRYMSAQAAARAGRAGVAAAAVAIALAAAAPARAETPRPPWDAASVDLAASIAVQDGGRVKPLGTLAGFKLLKLNGRRSLTTPDGEALAPVPWLLDCLFFPEAARRYEMFLVQNDEVLDAIGVAHEAKRKRDRYAFADLEAGMPRAFQLAQSYAAKPEGERTVVEGQVVDLAHNLAEFRELLHLMDFARTSFPVHGTKGLDAIFKPDEGGLAAVLSRARDVLVLAAGVREDASKDAADPDRAVERAALSKLFDALEAAAQAHTALALFPPPGTVAERPEWLSPSDLVLATFRGEAGLEPQLRCLADLETLERRKADPAAFRAKLAELAAGLHALGDARGEVSKIPLEVTFYKGDFFYRALYLYVLGFVLVALSWLRPDSKVLYPGVLASSGIASALLLAGIVLRCVIRGRPPVSTLYETILFITLMAVLVSAVIEGLNRNRIAAAVATTLGMLGMFLATKYEFKESVSAGDTMPSLVAVLDTNFWLATHVTAVTTGYSAGLLASAIAHVTLLARMFGLRRDEAFFKETTRMTYGVLLFGLFFSVVGTILGGIWANYSWGRFWGWDPKENGALLICLWELIILHARLGGYIRDLGLAVMAVLGGGVIAFSWWGVNLLGVGLHSYGFTSGVLELLLLFYAIEALVLLGAAIHWARGPRPIPLKS